MDTYVDTHMSGVHAKTSTGRNVIADNELKGNKKVMFQNEKEKNNKKSPVICQVLYFIMMYVRERLVHAKVRNPD